MDATGPPAAGGNEPSHPEPPKKGQYREVPILGIDESEVESEIRMLYITREHVIRQNAILEADAMRMEHQLSLVRELLARIVLKYGANEQRSDQKMLCLLVTDPEAEDDPETPPPTLVVDTTDDGTFLYVAGVTKLADDSGPTTVTLGGDSDAA